MRLCCVDRNGEGGKMGTGRGHGTDGGTMFMSNLGSREESC